MSFGFAASSPASTPGRPLDSPFVKRTRRGHVVRLVHIKTELLPVSDLSLSPEFSAFLVSPFYSLVKHAEQSGAVEDTSGTRHKGEIRSEGWVLRNMAEIYNTRPGVFVDGPTSAGQAVLQAISTRYGVRTLVDKIGLDLHYSTQKHRSVNSDIEMMARFMWEQYPLESFLFFIHARRALLLVLHSKKHKQLLRRYTGQKDQMKMLRLPGKPASEDMFGAGKEVHRTQEHVLICEEENLKDTYVFSDEWKEIGKMIFKAFGESVVAEFVGEMKAFVAPYTAQKDAKGSTPSKGRIVHRVSALMIIDMAVRLFDTAIWGNVVKTRDSLIDLAFPELDRRSSFRRLRASETVLKFLQEKGIGIVDEFNGSGFEEDEKDELRDESGYHHSPPSNTHRDRESASGEIDDVNPHFEENGQAVEEKDGTQDGGRRRDPELDAIVKSASSPRHHPLTDMVASAVARSARKHGRRFEEIESDDEDEGEDAFEGNSRHEPKRMVIETTEEAKGGAGLSPFDKFRRSIPPEMQVRLAQIERQLVSARDEEFMDQLKVEREKLQSERDATIEEYEERIVRQMELRKRAEQAQERMLKDVKAHVTDLWSSQRRIWTALSERRASSLKIDESQDDLATLVVVTQKLSEEVFNRIDTLEALVKEAEQNEGELGGRIEGMQSKIQEILGEKARVEDDKANLQERLRQKDQTIQELREELSMVLRREQMAAEERRLAMISVETQTIISLDDVKEESREQMLSVTTRAAERSNLVDLRSQLASAGAAITFGSGGGLEMRRRILVALDEMEKEITLRDIHIDELEKRMENATQQLQEKQKTLGKMILEREGRGGHEMETQTDSISDEIPLLQMVRMQQARREEQQLVKRLHDLSISFVDQFSSDAEKRFVSLETRLSGVHQAMSKDLINAWELTEASWHRERELFERKIQRLVDTLEEDRSKYDMQVRQFETSLRKLKEDARHEMDSIRTRAREAEMRAERFYSTIQEKESEVQQLRPGGQIFQEKLEEELRKRRLRDYTLKDINAINGRSFPPSSYLFFTLSTPMDEKPFYKSDVKRDTSDPSWGIVSHSRIDERYRSLSQFVVRIYNSKSIKKEHIVYEHHVDIHSLRPFDTEKDHDLATMKRLLLYMIGNLQYWSPAISGGEAK